MNEEKGFTQKTKPPTTYVIDGPRVLVVGPRPLVPLQLERCTVCRFYLRCFTTSMQVTRPARLCDVALNGRQGPHPPFHSQH